jgi:hypothetical protein
VRHALATILAALSSCASGSPCHTLFRVSPLHFSLAEKEFFISNFSARALSQFQVRVMRLSPF